MKIYKVGEKSKGICSSCEKMVVTTFAVTSVPLSSEKLIINDIMAAVCDECGTVVSIPQQSAPRIKEAMTTKKRSIEVRVPRHLIDILVVASDSFKMGAFDALVPVLIRYYIGLVDDDAKLIKNIKKLSSDDLAKGKSEDRLSLKVNEAIYQKFEDLKKKSKLSKTDVVKGLIMQINEDLLQFPVAKKLHDELAKVMLAIA